MNRVIAAACVLASAGVCGADVVTEWNARARDVIRDVDMISNPGTASRNLAILNTAVYDAVMSANPTHNRFHYTGPLNTAADPQAAAIEAGYRALSQTYSIGNYPGSPAVVAGVQADMLALRDSQLAAIPNGPAKSAGITLGAAVANDINTWRAGDGWNVSGPYPVSTTPGQWRTDPILLANHGVTQEAWGPQWGSMPTFGSGDITTFTNAVPDFPDWNSTEFAAAYNDVHEKGAAVGSTRTADETNMAKFWAYDRPGMGPPPIVFNAVIEQTAEQAGLDFQDKVRLFAMTSVAIADAGIAAWDVKFEQNIGRPVTIIREDIGILTGGAILPDPDWVPTGAPGPLEVAPGVMADSFTPPFATYVSGHATFGGALFEMLANFFGSDEWTDADDGLLWLASEEMPTGAGDLRSFDRFSDAMIENGRSRVLLGIHFSFDDEQGQLLGKQIADALFASHFAAVPEPASLGVLSIPLLLLKRRR